MEKTKEDFRIRFQKIVYKKGLVTESANKVKMLSVWDKNGSHEKAIRAEMERLKARRAEFKEALSGKTYDEWKKASARLSVLNSRLKKYAEGNVKAKLVQVEINEINNF